MKINKETINLEEMFKIQKNFTVNMERDINNIDINNLTYQQQCDILKDYAYSVIEEIVEFVRELETKRHKKIIRNRFDRQKVLDELVDSFKHWTNLLIISKFSIEDFKQAWINKTNIVSKRLEQEFK